MTITPTGVYVLLWLVFGLGALVLTFIMSAVCNAIEEWSERRKQNESAEAEVHLDAIKSMERIQAAYFQARTAMHDMDEQQD